MRADSVAKYRAGVLLEGTLYRCPALCL